MLRGSLSFLAVALLALPALLTGCPSPGAQSLRFEPDPLSVPDALPDYTSSGSVMLVNDTGSAWTLSAMAFSSSGDDGEAAARFEAVLTEGGSLPIDVPAGESLELTVVFSPQTVRGYESVLTASVRLSGYTVGGGGCSAGCGGEAPEDLTEFITLGVIGFGNEDALFEDCTDGEDNDDDGLIDCDDPDCVTHPDCEVTEDICDDEIDNDEDGLTDCNDPDCFGDPDCETDEEICDDGWDNDGDGRIDCEDPDCFGFPACNPVEGCEPVGDLTCGTYLVSNTDDGEDTWQDYCGVGDNGWTGNEDIWVFFADEPGEVEVTAIADWDLDLTILRARVDDEGTFICDPNECVATSWNPPYEPMEMAVFPAIPGDAYFVVIDGYGGDGGEYALDLQCMGGPMEYDCFDGQDNDGDGLVDCDDPDCWGYPECSGDGNCVPLEMMECEWGFGGDNAMPGSTNVVDDWCNEGYDGWTGPEVAFVFIPDFTAEVTVSMQGLSADLDLTVLLADIQGPIEQACNPSFCVDENWAGGANPEEVTFDAFAGTVYILAIDGWQGAISQFELTLTCGGIPDWEIDCGDEIDNDGDGLIDCDDPDCFGFPECFPGGEICDNGIDDDGNGLTDCDDVIACQAFPGCDYGDGDCCTDNGTPGCENDLGEDCVCAMDPYCCEVTWDMICADEYENMCGGTCGGPTGETICDDGIDNDNDGLVDCDDADCDGFPECVGPGFEFSCDNGIDDDFDGLTDCDDPDCAWMPECMPGFEDCTNGIDDDGDGLVDCADEDCLFDPTCDAGGGDCCIANGSPGCDDEPGEDCVCAMDPYCCNVTWDGICVDEYMDMCGGTCTGVEECANGLDDDYDGLVDCDDPDCAGDPICIPVPEDCANGIDDDGDGFIDCDDNECFGDPACPQPVEICDDGLDNDGNGLIDCDDPLCWGFPDCVIGPEDCTNGIDDDGDGMVDCDDWWDCSWHPACQPGFEDCTNGVDDDGDGLVDCDDIIDCAGDPACLPFYEDCTNGIDDDGDGLIDCADPDCQGTPWCPSTELDCTNNLDDDFDGLFDCADPDCFFDPACFIPGVETNCANGADDDGDGLVDCDDPDCVLDPNCNIVTFETSCVDGIDNDADGMTDCDDPDCAAHPNCNFPPESDCGNGIDDDADGYTDCYDSDCATSPLCATGEDVCDDNIDNDGDGDIDCDDSDCSADIACVTTGACNPIGNLSCGDVISGSNDMAGSTMEQDVYCGYNPGGWDGPEVSWVFTPDSDGWITITLSGLTADLDIQALNQTIGPDGVPGCDVDDCEANGWNPPPQDEYMDWFGFAGTPYYVLIDGWWGAVSSFTMTVECTPDSEVDCSDGIDNDQDGDVDCADIDCLGSPDCPELDCDNGIDDDADGHIDCADPDCYGTPTCVPETNCVDGIDNDSDGLVDCDDDDCDIALACQPESDCADGLDNDGDGLIDCDDSDCDDSPDCGLCFPVEAELTCGDVVFADNSTGYPVVDSWCGMGGADFAGPEQYFTVWSPDANTVTVSLFGLSADLDLFALLTASDGGCAPDNCIAYDPAYGADPEDIDFPVAAGAETFVAVDGWQGATSSFGLAVTCGPVTQTEICDDGLDNDGDGDEDCFDSDCAGSPFCLQELDCGNGFDDDADGMTDCNDDDCFGEPGCPVIIFSSVDDSPNDFVHFPLSDHASATDWEQGWPDSAAQSGGGPNAPYAGTAAWCTGCDMEAVDGGRFNAYLVAQPTIFDLAAYSGGTLELSFHHWQVSPGFPMFDISRVAASPDGGNQIDVIWGPVTASTASWDLVVLDLSTYLGGDLTLGFRYDSLTGFGGGADGWYLDDVELIWYP